jgi:hypothetical protein
VSSIFGFIILILLLITGFSILIVDYTFVGLFRLPGLQTDVDKIYEAIKANDGAHCMR